MCMYDHLAGSHAAESRDQPVYSRMEDLADPCHLSDIKLVTGNVSLQAGTHQRTRE